MKMNTILKALQTIQDVRNRVIEVDDLTQRDLDRLKELSEFERNRYVSEGGADKYNQLLRDGKKKEAFEQGLRIGIHELTIENITKLKEMEKMNNKIEVAKVIDNITEQAELEAAKYYEGNEDWRQMTIKNIDDIDTMEELEDYLITLNESEQSYLDEIETTKVSPYNKDDYERELAIARLKNEIKEIELYREHALNKIKEMERMNTIMNSNSDSTGIALKQLQKEENDRMKKMQTGMEIGERMKLKEGIAIKVAYNVHKRRLVSEYFSIIASLPIEETKDRASRELVYELVKEGLAGTPVIVAYEVNKKNKKNEYEPASYRVQQEFMKVRMLMPEAFEFDEELALTWIERGVNHEDVIARFEEMMKESIAQEDYYNELTLNEIMFDEYEDTKNPIGKIHSEIDML